MYKFKFEEEVFHGDMFGAIADVAIRDIPTDEQCERICSKSAVIFCKTDFLQYVFNLLSHAKPENRYILITHNSDYAIDDQKFFARTPNIVRWYALNVAIADMNLVPIPSGMERPLGGGYSSHPEVIVEQLTKPREYKNLVYMNHNENNNHGERDFVTGFLKDKPWVTYRKHGQSFVDFIDNCYNHKFVLSPPGNGIDCHRTWEALWCGSIPIVKRSILIDSFSDLPMLIVEDWSLLTEELLNIVWEEFQKKTFDYSKMTFSFWERVINSERSNLT